MDLSHYFKNLVIKESPVVTNIDSNTTVQITSKAKKAKNTHGGGANTNKNGLTFEKKTCVKLLCTEHGFVKDTTYNSESGALLYKELLYKECADYKLYSCSKIDFKKFVSTEFKKEMYRQPDDVFIVIKQNGPTKIYIIEKKTQSQSGSVDEKLFAGSYYLADYRLNFGPGFEIIYIFCLDTYLWNAIENPRNLDGSYNKWKNYKQLISPEIKFINGDKDYKKQIFEAIPELKDAVSN